MNGNTIKIKNKKTGEIKEVPISALSTYGLDTSGAMGETPETEAQAPGWAEKMATGLGPLAGLLTPGGRKAIPAGLEFLVPHLQTGVSESVKRFEEERPTTVGEAISPVGAAKRFGGFMQPLVAPAAEISAYKIAPALMKKVLPWLTRGGVAGKATEEALKKTKAGVSMTWDELSGQISKKVYQRLGTDTDVVRTVTKMLARKAPAGVEAIPETLAKTPTELLAMRRQLLERYGLKMLDRLAAQPGTRLEEKIASVARNVISENVHRLVPETITPDKLYAFYSKVYPGVKKAVAVGAGAKIAEMLGLTKAAGRFLRGAVSE